MRILYIIGLFLLILGCKPPEPVGEETYPVNFEWTASGAHGYVGQASIYDMRCAFDTVTLIQWNKAKQLTGLPIPAVVGSTEQYSTKVIPGVTYYFALKVCNQEGICSQISNIKKFNSSISLSNKIYFNH